MCENQVMCVNDVARHVNELTGANIIFDEDE